MAKILDDYRKNIALAELEIKRVERLINIYSFLRLGAIIAGFILIYQSLQLEQVWLTELSFFLVVIVFGWLVSRQSKYEKAKNLLADRIAVNQNEIHSIQSFTNMYDNGSDWQDDGHVYTSDLDIFGPSSLYQLINRCATQAGRQTLARWLQRPDSASVIRQRQQAVKEIVLKPEWKIRLQTQLLFSNRTAGNPIQLLLRYLDEKPLRISKNIRAYARIAGWIFFPALITSFFVPVVWLLVILIAVVNLFIIQITQTKAEHTEMLISKIGNTLSGFSESFEVIEEQTWQSELADKLSLQFQTTDHGGVSYTAKHLTRLINRVNLGSVPLVGFVLKVSMLWNLRQLFAIESWKLSNKKAIAEAFESVAQFEALCSLAGLSVNHPEYQFPDIVESDGYMFNASAIGHPLISAQNRVVNDFCLSDALNIDIITGSNMAGKSTFLRTVGVNAVLAFSGAAVCARSMQITPFTIFSYMRIRDSLNENTSTFKAELDRLKLLLDVLNRKEKVYFLIDEMLRGTNSVDKYRGSKAVIEKLITQKAVGIVATHDLQIAELEDSYPHYVRNFYFDIEVQGDEMRFDYQLKEGRCKTFNASLLLRRLGIDVD